MLKGKVAVITAEPEESDLQLLKNFWKTKRLWYCSAPRQETVDKALAALKEENPDWPVSGAWPDLGSEEAVAAELEKIRATHGKIDILINNAGMSDSKPVTEYTSEHFEKIMKLNVGAAMNCIIPLSRS